jgi:20S proteasome subunit alpha 6
LPEDGSKEYVSAPHPIASDDPTLPNFATLLQSASVPVSISVYLDRNKPLSEPKWVRTGDVNDLLTSVFGKSNFGGQAIWANKVAVVDPDPVSVS